MQRHLCAQASVWYVGLLTNGVGGVVNARQGFTGKGPLFSLTHVPPHTSSSTTEKSKCKEADGIACKRVVGYITNWATYRTKPWNFDMTDTDASKYTHLIYAFASMSRE